MVDAYPKKALGQHWLHDAEVLEAMCDAADATSGSEVLEIGPGLGTLTLRLLSRGSNVRALEFDHELVVELEQNISRLAKEQGMIVDLGKLQVTEGDIRTFDFQTMPSDYRICANIPYYLTSNLIRLLCDTENKPLRAALLMQKEVAERIAASGTKMSLLSCITQFYFEVELSDFVPAKLFTPPPKVDSQILVLKKRDVPIFDVDQKQFFRLLKAGFSEKRKTLRNALSGGLSISKDKTIELLGYAQIDPMRRAETLTLLEWKQLFDSLDVLSK
jgi:16S rRNA (adenine1518-N6/adenine1519-N6)-dimethyltransferase